jgi:predicted nucleic-acid-binding Zn-ribbon protein
VNMGTKAKPRIRKSNRAEGRPKCELCGKTKKLTKTECCGQWICDDEGKYVLFSYATNSCYRNHRRYTLYGYHFSEGHPGDWKDCPKCRNSFETEMYVYYGTNEFNFQKLENPPAYLPTKCARCGAVISLGYDGYSTLGDKYWCEECTHKEMERIHARPKR